MLCRRFLKNPRKQEMRRLKLQRPLDLPNDGDSVAISHEDNFLHE